jgi:CDP-glucose 4,6-dehydratase
LLDQAFWEGRRVLVTGHTGFKGAWLCLWLRRLGADVSGFASGAPATSSLFAIARLEEIVQSSVVDVRDYGAVRAAVARHRPEVVLHLAAQPLVRRSLAEPVETYATNVLGTVHVLEAVREAAPEARAVLCVTSDKCYANRGWHWGYRESDPLGGADPYSSSKACQELVAAAFRDSLLAPRVAVATARAGNVIGGGDWARDRLVPDLMRAALAGERLIVRNPQSIRPWQHVLNPLSGYLRLVERLWAEGAAFAEAWNFAPPVDDARPVAWIVERLRERWPGELPVDLRPHGDGGAEPHIVKLDASKARARLGWTPRWSLSQALDAIVEWYAAYQRGDDIRAVTARQIAVFEA